VLWCVLWCKGRCSAQFSLLARSENCDKRLISLSCLSVCPSSWDNSAPTGRIFIKFDFGAFLENLSRKFNFYCYLTRIRGTLHEDRYIYTFMIVCPQFFLEWEIFRTKFVEKIKTHFVFGDVFFRKSCPLYDNVGKYCRAGQTTDGNMAHARCILDT
jgi:hypothetical protein